MDQDDRSSISTSEYVDARDSSPERAPDTKERTTHPDLLNNARAANHVTLQVSMAAGSPDDSSIPSTPRVPSPNFRTSNNSSPLNLLEDHVTRHYLCVSKLRNLSVDSSSSSSSDPVLGPPPLYWGNCPSPSRLSPVPPSSPQGPRFKLLAEGQVHVCRLNHTRTVISKLLSSRFLRRWEVHFVILDDSFITSRHPGGFMEEPIPYRIIQDIYPVARWDSCGRFCIRIVIPDGSLLFQVSNSYLRDQWLHSLLWKRSIFRFRKVLDSCGRTEILLKELKSLVDLVLSTPLQDETIFHTALNIISEVAVKGQTWMPKCIAEEVIVIISLLFEKTTPTSEICDFFCWYCKENPRSAIVLEICTPIAQRILKHNMDFGKYPQTRVFVQDYFLSLNCQNRAENAVKEFVDGLHGMGSKCPHPRVLQNLVNICVAAIYNLFESRRADCTAQLGAATSCGTPLEVIAEETLKWQTKLDCFIKIFILISRFDDWRESLAEMLQPVPFHEDALSCSLFMTPFREVVYSMVHDCRCNVHQTVLPVRDGKEGWYHLYKKSLLDEEGDFWFDMLDRLLSCCMRRKKFMQVVVIELGPIMLRALRNDERCQRALCDIIEYDCIAETDFHVQAVQTLQSTTNGKRLYAALCERQMQLRQVQKKGGPRKLCLPNKSTDADVTRLLNSGSFGDLECLSLAFTQVTSACAVDIVKLSSLKYLSLWSTQFDDKGLIVLTEHLPKLDTLDLCETRISDEGARRLTAMKSLRRINLNSTNLSAETYEILKQNLPILQEIDLRYTEAWGF